MKIGRKEPSNISLSSLDEVSMVISLTFSDTPMKPLFSFYASQHPCFLVSRQWNWFDWCSYSISKAGWSPQCGGYLHSSGRNQSDPWRDRKEKCEASTDTVSPEVGDSVGLCYCVMHRWTLARSPGWSPGSACTLRKKVSWEKTWAPRAGGWPLAPWPHLPVFLKFTVLGAIN